MAACETGNSGVAGTDLAPIIAAVATRITISVVAPAASARWSTLLFSLQLHVSNLLQIHKGERVVNLVFP